MKVRLCITAAHHNLPTDCEEVTVADGLADEQIEKAVESDLHSMAFEFVDIWWERVAAE